jgi:hypothetical protein
MACLICGLPMRVRSGMGFLGKRGRPLAIHYCRRPGQSASRYDRSALNPPGGPHPPPLNTSESQSYNPKLLGPRSEGNSEPDHEGVQPKILLG